MKRKAFREYMEQILEERSKLSLLESITRETPKRQTPTFNEYLREQLLMEEVNAHMTHVEDLMFNEGVGGTRKAINFFRDLRDMLSGHSKTKTNLTIKYDGAPAIFAGTDPEDGRFFVAKKSIFNKTPKVYKTPEEVKADTSGDLQKKMLLALKYLPSVGIDGILQGDFMYDKSSLKKEKIDGVEYFTFHPNTIVYAVPVDSTLGRRISRSKIGIIWHTRYTGRTLSDIRGSFDSNITKGMKKSQDVWFDDASFKDLSGNASFTAEETKAVNDLLSEAGSLFQRMNSSTINGIHKNPELNKLVHIFMNQKVRNGLSIGDSDRMANDLKEFITNRYDDKINSLKKEEAKAKWAQQKRDVMSYFDNNSDSDIANMFELLQLLTKIKLTFVDKLNSITSMGTFLKTNNGFKTTGQEGFVAVDHTRSGAVKLVDRLEFSMANFSPEYLKGWQ